MYFAAFESYRKVRDGNQAFTIVVERHNAPLVQSSPIPMEALADVLEEIATVETGSPIHLWIGPSKELVIIPFAQISAVRVAFQ